MAPSPERLKILKMVQEGKITAEEAIQLIEALDESAAARQAAGGPEMEPLSSASASKSAARWLRVRVTDTNTGRVRVNVRLPINVVSAGLKMGAKFSPEVQGLDVEQLMAFVRSGETGQIVDVYDDEDGEHVEVFVE
jgi:hypothetical protein